MDDLGFDIQDASDKRVVQTEKEQMEMAKIWDDGIDESIGRLRGTVNIPMKRKTIDKHKNVTTELLMNTEQYRIDEIFALLKVTPKDTTRQQAVRYLLSYSDLLDRDMAREVIDIANKMLTDETVRDTVKVKIASDLKAFLGTAGKKKFVRSTFEELRKEDGFLEVEVPD
jgi:hypothetical protein